MLLSALHIAHLLRCPRCKSPLDGFGDGAQPFACGDARCELSKKSFPVIAGQPVLLDFDHSVIDQKHFRASTGASTVKRDPMRASPKARIQRALLGDNPAAKRAGERVLADVCARSAAPIVLVIGGGERGSGTDALYAHERVGLIGSDVYVSENVTLVADGHQLPLDDQCVDAVWIQAVLEHVLDPGKVVAEIHRVLKPHGLVYADTPFMQQVHEGAHDFTRFTLSGHRWLFRSFELVDAGYAGGPGVALNWSIRYFIRALTGSEKLGALAGLAFFWLRFFDRWAPGRGAADAASGVFFYGRRSEGVLTPKEAIAFYQQQTALIARHPRDARPPADGVGAIREVQRRS
jgi:SAM-dependent methyltransferase